jgi:TolB protein
MTSLTVRVPAFLAIPVLVALSGCASSSATKPVAQAPAPVEAAPTPRRVINPFGERSAVQASAAQTGGAEASVADGTRAGFSSSPSYNIFGETPSTNHAAIEQRETFESTENVLRVSNSDVGSDFDPSVSPDGQWVFFASTRHRPTSDIYMKRVDGTAITQLTSDAAQDVMPSVSPDGKRIAFASNRAGSYDIYVMSASGGQAIQVTSDPGQELRPTWSPDGKTLAFCRTAEGNDRWEIWVTDVNRPGNTRFLTYGLFPTWQPGGHTIAFQRSRERGDRYFSIWTVDYINGEAVNPTEVISSAVAACINPSWSPDGGFIAFSTVVSPDSLAANTPAPGRVSPTQADLWIVKADGSARASLTAGPAANLSPAWGPGNRVFFVSNRAGNDNLWSIGSEQALVAMGEVPERSTATARGKPMMQQKEMRPAPEAAAEHEQASGETVTEVQGGGEAEPH